LQVYRLNILRRSALDDCNKHVGHGLAPKKGQAREFSANSRFAIENKEKIASEPLVANS
jgi:hypothetical protein